ncbi:MAG: tRNA (adenosine(37)-N6)-threonylcarbamoyltransferase complex dimerization subunit type 1 TsaB [Fidelibacterota bacterium]
MNLLAVETATDVCSMALMLDNQVAALYEENIPRQHAKKLPSFFQTILNEQRLDLSDLDGIAVSIGPGSFTGLRIGLSYSKGLAYSNNLPIIPVPTLEGVAQGCMSQNSFNVLLYSHRNLIYHQKFSSKNKPINNASISTWDQLKEVLDKESIFQINCENYIKKQPIAASAKYILKCASEYYDEWVQIDPQKLIPNYIAQFEFSK